MLNRSPLGAFALTAKPAAAVAFYRDVLGLDFVHEDDFAIVFIAHGTTLRISKVPEFVPAAHTILGWQVDDIVSIVKQLGAKDVEFQRYPGMEQDALGIWTVPDGTKVAWFKDPDGNVLSLSQSA